jgi:hypothetical protein
MSPPSEGRGALRLGEALLRRRLPVAGGASRSFATHYTPSLWGKARPLRRLDARHGRRAGRRCAGRERRVRTRRVRYRCGQRGEARFHRSPSARHGLRVGRPYERRNEPRRGLRRLHCRPLSLVVMGRRVNASCRSRGGCGLGDCRSASPSDRRSGSLFGPH